MSAFFVTALCLLFALAVSAQPTSFLNPPSSVLANRPMCVAGNEGTRHVVTDCINGACATGGGSTVVAFDCIGAAWKIPGTGGGGGGGALGPNLTAIDGLTTAANQITLWTGSGTASQIPVTVFAQSILDDANASTARATLGLEIGTNVQAWDADLDAIAALTTTLFGRSLLTRADAPASRTLLGVPGLTTQNTFTGPNTFTASTAFGSATITNFNPGSFTIFAGSLVAGGAQTTVPNRAGGALPAACQLNETFLLTTAPAAEKFHVCTATNVWTKQGGSGDPTLGVVDTVQLSDGAGKHKAGPALSAVVQTFGNQTISGLKTFDGVITSSGNANFTGNATISGAFIASGASSTRPHRTVATATALPASCGVSSTVIVEDAAADRRVYVCTAPNVWTQQGGSGSGAPLAADGEVDAAKAVNAADPRVLNKVTGPTTAQDNAIARFDATTGKLIQSSTATIDDLGNASFNSVTTPDPGDGFRGFMFPDNTTTCPDPVLGSTALCTIGGELFVRDTSGPLRSFLLDGPDTIGPQQLQSTGVTNGTYGGSVQSARIVVDEDGRITSASSEAIRVRRCITYRDTNISTSSTITAVADRVVEGSLGSPQRYGCVVEGSGSAVGVIETSPQPFTGGPTNTWSPGFTCTPTSQTNLSNLIGLSATPGTDWIGLRYSSVTGVVTAVNWHICYD